MVTISNGPGHLAGQQGNMFKNNIQYQTLNLKKGECLFHQGANIERLFFLEKGRVKLIRNTIEGQPLIIHICQVSPRYSLLSKTTLRNISGFLINKSGFKLYQYSKAS